MHGTMPQYENKYVSQSMGLNTKDAQQIVINLLYKFPDRIGPTP